MITPQTNLVQKYHNDPFFHAAVELLYNKVIELAFKVAKEEPRYDPAIVNELRCQLAITVSNIDRDRSEIVKGLEDRLRELLSQRSVADHRLLGL